MNELIDEPIRINGCFNKFLGKLCLFVKILLYYFWSCKMKYMLCFFWIKRQEPKILVFKFILYLKTVWFVYLSPYPFLNFENAGLRQGLFIVFIRKTWDLFCTPRCNLYYMHSHAYANCWWWTHKAYLTKFPF